MRRGLTAICAGGLLALAAPAVASADTTYCVPAAAIAGCPVGGVTEATITAAMNAVNANTGAHDTIRIGPQATPYVEDVPMNTASHRVDVIGAGVGQTVIQGVAGANKTSLDLREPTSTASNLTLRLADGNTNIGLNVAGSATNIGVTANPSDAAGTGVTVGATSSVLARANVTLPFNASVSSTGVTTAGGSVQDSTISAGTGVSGNGNIVRSRITATTGGTPSSFSPGSLTLDDDLIVTAPSSGSEQGVSVPSSPIPGPSGTATVRHSTLVGDNTSGSNGIAVNAGAVTGPASASATVDSSIIVGFAHALSATATGGITGGSAASASISIDYSNFDSTTDFRNPTTPTNGPCGNPSCAASTTITLGTHNVNLAPQFANPTSGDYHLLTTSPLLYNGNPTLASGESSTDLDGSPRTTTRNGATVTDIGAFQHQQIPPVVAVGASPPRAAPGTPITFTATVTEPNPGDTVTLGSWTFDDGTTASGSNAITHTFATPGNHTATLTARDLDGLTGTGSATVAIVASTPPPTPGAKPGLITNETIVPSSFAAAPSGPTVVAAKRVFGALVSYLDSAAGVTTFTVQRPVPGRMNGKACLKAGKKKHKAKGKPCTLYQAVGSFTHVDVAGPNKFRFTGRLNGRKLKPGSYRLQAVTANTAGRGAPVYTKFRIIR